MTAQQIITKFELYLDDGTELSSAEELDLLNKHYRMINSSHTWEGTKAEHSATASGTTVSLPSDFLYLTANHNMTDSSYEAERPVVFFGTTYTPIEVVSWSDRRQYRDNGNYAWIDYPNSNLVFGASKSGPVEFDYHAQKADLAIDETPWFPAEFHDAIYHFMCADDYIVQQSPKAKSYRDENIGMGTTILNNMKWWNSQLVQM